MYSHRRDAKTVMTPIDKMKWYTHHASFRFAVRLNDEGKVADEVPLFKPRACNTGFMWRLLTWVFAALTAVSCWLQFDEFASRQLLVFVVNAIVVVSELVALEANCFIAAIHEPLASALVRKVLETIYSPDDMYVITSESFGEALDCSTTYKKSDIVDRYKAHVMRWVPMNFGVRVRKFRICWLPDPLSEFGDQCTLAYFIHGPYQIVHDLHKWMWCLVAVPFIFTSSYAIGMEWGTWTTLCAIATVVMELMASSAYLNQRYSSWLKFASVGFVPIVEEDPGPVSAAASTDLARVHPVASV